MFDGLTPARPVLRIPRSTLERFLEGLAAIGLAWLLVQVVSAWPRLPERIPHHFGLSGKPDAWGGKRVLVLLPAVGAGLYILLTVVSFFPHKFNYLFEITVENAERQYRIARLMITAIKAEVVWLFAYICALTIRVALGKAEGLSTAFAPVILTVVLGTVAAGLYASWKAR